MATLIYTSGCLLLPKWLPCTVEFNRCVFCTSEIILVDLQPHLWLLVSHSHNTYNTHCTVHLCILVLFSFANIFASGGTETFNEAPIFLSLSKCIRFFIIISLL
jgi:hypothetical protein